MYLQAKVIKKKRRILQGCKKISYLATPQVSNHRHITGNWDMPTKMDENYIYITLDLFI